MEKVAFGMQNTHYL